MNQLVVDVKTIKNNISRCLETEDKYLNEKDINLLCDTYIRYFVLRSDPAVLSFIKNLICNENYEP
jgi:hypothetical protein